MNNSSSVSPNSIDHKTYIKYILAIEPSKNSSEYFIAPKLIYIFNCENDKYFITYHTVKAACINIINDRTQISPVYVPSGKNNYIEMDNDLVNLPIPSFVNKYCPHLNECHFIKKNKIISMREIKSLILYEYTNEKMQSISLSLRTHSLTPEIQMLKFMEIYENNLDDLIIKYMHKYGIDNVRGGSFSDEILTKDQIKQIQDKFKKLNLDQLNGVSVIEFNQHQIKLNLTTKYLNMNHIEDEVNKYKTDLANFRAEMDEIKAELVKFKTIFVKQYLSLDSLD
jgi:hypothetical protein